MNKNVATYLGRTLVALFGIGLLTVSIVMKVWWKGDFRTMLMFGALIGLFLGYGLGGDIWGARFFDFFAHTQSAKVADKPVPPMLEKLAQFLGCVLLGFLVLVFVSVMVILVRQHRGGANNAVEPTRALPGARGSP
jgi:hypothetical protein